MYDIIIYNDLKYKLYLYLFLLLHLDFFLSFFLSFFLFLFFFVDRTWMPMWIHIFVKTIGTRGERLEFICFCMSECIFVNLWYVGRNFVFKFFDTRISKLVKICNFPILHYSNDF